MYHLRGQSVPGAAASHEARLADAAAVLGVVSEVQPQRVTHLAAIGFVARGDAQARYTTNLLGTRNLLEACVGKLDTFELRRR